jgi:hypothetical protein
MAPLVLIVELVPLVAHTDKRAVGFLRGHKDLTAATEYDNVTNTPLGKRLRHKMGLWIAFKPDTEGKFHRFKNEEPQYRDCIVFIDLEEQVRFYGFTCHPDSTNLRFELALLTDYAIKKTHLTDKTYLRRVVMWQNNMATKLAMKTKYSDKKAGKR